MRVEVLLSDNTSIVRYVSVDTFTGEITAMRDTDKVLIAGTQPFTDQLNSVANEIEKAQEDLVVALKQ